MKKEILVISLGGSIIVPDSIDISFLKEFRKLILDYTDKYQFIIATGGGKTAREYAEAADQIAKTVSKDDKDWLGIYCTRLNAHLVKTIFGEKAYAKVMKDPTKKIKTAKPIVVAAGYKPGSSSDYDAVMLAKTFKTKRILNLTNIDYVYNKDPKKHTFAKPLKELTWAQYRKIIPEKFEYGMHTPFDPVASRLAEKLKLEVVVMNGHKLMQVKNYLDKKKFIGSVIKK
ncbi:UMP kinase [Candidatus Woesearchaeota archaeon]|nr:UMP kinase [Candidatus Woesearchaeota archaeon]